MNLLHKRPLLAVSLGGAVISLYLVRASALTALILAGLVMTAFAVFLILLLCKHGRLLLPVLILSLSIPLLSSMWHIHRPQMRAQEETGAVAVEAKVITAEKSIYGTGLTLAVRSVNGKRVLFRALCTVDSDASIHPEDTLTLVGQLTPIDSAHKDRFLRKDGLFVAIEEVQGWTVTGRSFSLRAKLDALRQGLADTMEKQYATEGGTLLPSLLLGVRDELPPYAAPVFRRMGLSHLLALSGLHLSILCAGFYALCRKLRVSAGAARLICAAFVILYALLVGASPSIIRSAIMTLCAIAASRKGDPLDSYTSLGVAVLVILLLSPGSVFDASFWLSVLATLGILVAVSSSRGAKLRQKGWKARLLLPLLLTAGATVATLLPVALLYGELSVLSPVANLLLTPILPLLIYLAFFHLLLSPIPYVGAAIGLVLSLISQGLLLAIQWIASLPNLMLSVSAPPALAGIGLSFALLACMLLLPRGARVWGKAAGATLAAVFVAALFVQMCSTRTSWLSYETSGRNDILLCSDGRKQALILSDGGGSDSLSAVALALEARSLTELDALVLTHCHQGHARSLESLLTSIHVHALYLPEAQTEEELAILETIVHMTRAHRVPVFFYQAGETLELGAFRYVAIEGSDSDKQAFTLSGKGQEICVVTASFLADGGGDGLTRALESAHTLILSAHGRNFEGPLYLTPRSATRRVVVAALIEERNPLILRTFADTSLRQVTEWSLRIRDGRERYAIQDP